MVASDPRNREIGAEIDADQDGMDDQPWGVPRHAAVPPAIRAEREIVDQVVADAKPQIQPPSHAAAADPSS